MNTKRNNLSVTNPLEYYGASLCLLKCPSEEPMEILRAVEVLVLAEDPDFSQSMGAILQDQGYQIYLAPDAATAAEELDNYNFDLLILQSGPNNAAGLAAVRKARQVQSSPKVMVISGPKSKALPVEAFEVEVDDYLLFPFSTAEFIRRVAALLDENSAAPGRIQGLSPTARVNARALESLIFFMEEIRNSLLQAGASLQGLHRREFGHLSKSGAQKLDEVMDHLSQAAGLAWHFHQKTCYISQMNGWWKAW